MAFNFGGAMGCVWIEPGGSLVFSKHDRLAPHDVDVLTEPVNNDPMEVRKYP